ncbi:hypothetical protein V491_03889 [Pseudogymnoascus sp. VKM F-3775]|nr:hypothetical protein V491_03889 [Pseudogymnoascus sp. VKM F-3775]
MDHSTPPLYPKTKTKQPLPVVTSSTIFTNINPNQQNLIAVSIFSVVHHVGATFVRKLPRTDDAFSLPMNIQAMNNEATIYTLLGENPRIVRCLSMGKTLDYVDLEYYPQGALMNYILTSKEIISDASRILWARQIIEAVALIHEKGIIHSDLALRQFFLDSDLNARLGDFGASGYPGQEALGMECASHFLPRNPDEPNTVASDLFTLGSTLYELGFGEAPYRGLNDDVIESLYVEGEFPSVDGVFWGSVVLGCWRCELSSAKDVLIRFEGLFDAV